MPNYKTINERKYILRDVIRLQGLEIKIGDKVFQADGKSAFIPNSKVQIYFLDNKELFNTDGFDIYNNSSKKYKDNPDRYIFFSIGCLETLKLLHWQPDTKDVSAGAVLVSALLAAVVAAIIFAAALSRST